MSDRDKAVRELAEEIAEDLYATRRESPEGLSESDPEAEIGVDRERWEARLRAFLAEREADKPQLFTFGHVTLSSGTASTWKIDCDALTDSDLEVAADLIHERVHPFGSVEGIPSGGDRLASILRRKCTEGPLLIVDDVLTTGGSMERQRAGREAIGAVLFARGECPSWVTPLFQLSPIAPTFLQAQLHRALGEGAGLREWIESHDLKHCPECGGIGWLPVLPDERGPAIDEGSPEPVETAPCERCSEARFALAASPLSKMAGEALGAAVEKRRAAQAFSKTQVGRVDRKAEREAFDRRGRAERRYEEALSAYMAELAREGGE